ncbi:enhanced entry protein EnhA (plasmid) [Legionella adelaidensis]|uniref:Enhanced entry protein EnhA n=1 Tax=Legionella adelaidensis TaxID=45056 RepID=A0A0W0R2X7_9GAMM|nr:L,D-transpeptidase [Legionella adelaidensis]KTC65408.1 enhanced entry protein EnhA [Legionella adelaidensis]VEH84770.1 enhanced entry protein EnhA [Legionella adelaidensis]
MKRKIIAAAALCFISFVVKAEDKPIYYGPALCAYPEYECITIRGGETWEKLFPNEEQRDIVQRINRSYNYLWAGKKIAVPKDLDHITVFDVSPFPLKIHEDEKEKQIVVDQDKLAWAAYDNEGNLVKWGPISSGSDRCSDNSSPTCRSLTGIYRVFSKEGPKCKSNIFPIGKGGAKMPWCMFFHKGIALHGSDDIPGYRASHGCIRMFTEDAKWLNLNFVESSNASNNNLGTKVIVRPLQDTEKKP